MLNQQIQNYKIISLLGEGGMGDVYLGEHISIKRKVAIKVLKPELVKNEEIRKRFKNEASMLAHLQHPNIVGLVDYVEQEDGLFLIMEYVDGQGLDELIKAQHSPINIERAKKLMTQILQAFLYAHKNGIIHRDVKPSNILVTADDQIKVLDFGIAKLVGDDQHHLTKTGTQIGTVYYMSPEQVKGKELDHRSDIYSLGVTFYELLSGVCPYRGMTTEYEIYDNIVKEPLLPLTQTMGEAYASVWSVIEKATQKEVNKRFQDCDEFIQDLEKGRVLQNPKPAVKPVSKPAEIKPKKIETKESGTNKWLFISLILIGLVSFGGYFLWRKSDEKVPLKWRIETGHAQEGDGYAIDYAFYVSEGDSLLPYQLKVNELIQNFVLEHSFINNKNSFKDLTLDVAFFSKVLSESKMEANKESTEYESSITDSIFIDTNFILFDQVVMSMWGYMAGGTGWQAVSYKIVEKESAKILGLQDFVSNVELFTNIAENCFRKQMGLSNSEDFGDEFTFENAVFYCPKDFYFADGNFYFSYQKYEVSAGAAGNVSFAVPISEVEHLLTRELSTKEPMTNIAPKDAEIEVVQLETDEVLQMMSNYYLDIINETFDANTYFAMDVKQFISRKNLTPEDVNEINQSNVEYTQRNVNILTETVNFDRIEENIQYWIYWINFSCYRPSKGQYQKCNVRIEVGIDTDNKLVSYRELDVTDLVYLDYDPADGY